jgi:hypothetical protein
VRVAGGARVWDLLPAEHARMWPTGLRDDLDVVGVRFVRPDGRAANAARTKVAKGLLTAHLLATRAARQPRSCARPTRRRRRRLAPPLGEGWEVVEDDDGSWRPSSASSLERRDRPRGTAGARRRVTDVIGTIGIIGGTGPHGRGLALRLRESGHRVLLGSRDAARARGGRRRAPRTDLHGTGGTIVGVDNVTAAAREGDLVIVTTPWDGFEAVGAAHAPDLAGKVVVSCANPLRFEGGGPMPVRLEDGSAAELLQRVCPGRAS